LILEYPSFFRLTPKFVDRVARRKSTNRKNKTLEKSYF
jgi:hypothetical protein